MSAEKIIEQIKKDSDKEIKQIQKDAEKQVKIILDTSKKKAEMEVIKIQNDSKIEAENLKKILISKASQDSKREIMNAREKIIDDCFTKAHSELSKLKGKEYNFIVKRLIEDGVKKLGKNCKIMVSREEDKKIAQEAGVTVDGTIESSGGVVIKSSDGKILLDHTFKGILYREKNRIRIEIGKLLFS
jgi:vacuolar-type H+-ATPase subunit E/Vma4